MEVSLLLIFWYGILHAFGPDHLMAITDFSIGRQRKKVMMVTLGFALGHGISLYLFAWILSLVEMPAGLLHYADLVAAGVIFLMGSYLLYLVQAHKIQVTKHEHEGKSHIHIWFGSAHDHHEAKPVSMMSAAASMGLLMGIGGVRGMLITLSAISHQEVTGLIVLSFTLGVALVFVLFGVGMSLLNEQILTSQKMIRGSFIFAGLLSLGVGGLALIRL